MKSLIYIVTFILFTQNIFAQQKSSTTNYNLASKFSTKRLEKMVFSLNVDPHWLKLSDRFWYEFETPKGKNWYIVDAIKAEKKLMFDNAKLAAEITKIVKDPFDSQHLEIDSLRFIKDENWIQFEVKSTQEIEVKDSVLRILSAGVPVMGHLGLTPQSIYKFGDIHRTRPRGIRSSKTG